MFDKKHFLVYFVPRPVIRTLERLLRSLSLQLVLIHEHRGVTGVGDNVSLLDSWSLLIVHL